MFASLKRWFLPKRSNAAAVLYRMGQGYRLIESKFNSIPGYSRLSSHLHAFFLNLKNYNPEARLYLSKYESLKVRRGHILFDSYWGAKVGCHPYALYKALIGSQVSKKLRFIWVLNNHLDAPVELLRQDRVKFVRYGSKGFCRALLTAEILITNNNLPSYFVPKKDQKVFSTWHGIPIKRLGSRKKKFKLAEVFNTQRNFNISTGVILPSTFAFNSIVGSYSGHLAKPFLTGSPRVDLTINTDGQSIKRKLGLPEDSKIVLYAPTWRGDATHKAFVADGFLGDVLGATSSALDESYRVYSSFHHLIKKASKLTSRFENTPKNIDINEFLSAVDVLISDYSSIVFDFLPLDRPIILYVPDRSLYETKRGLEIDPATLPVTVATSRKQLEGALAALRRPSSLKYYRSVRKDIMPIDDGAASVRALSIVLGAKALPSLNGKSKILVYPGSWKANGITNAILALAAQLDYSRFDLFVLVDILAAEATVESKRRFKQLDPRAKVLFSDAMTLVAPPERRAFNRFLTQSSELSASQIEVIDSVFAREARRLVGDNSFDISIDFAGYNPYWTKLMASVPSNRKLIFQHNDLVAEMNHPRKNYGQLVRVFECYRHFDKIVSVSEGLKEVNSRNLSKYAEPEKFVCVPNLIDADRVNKLAEMPLGAALDAILKVPEGRPPKLACIGRLSPEKNHDKLLLAARLVADRGRDFVMYFAGEGPLRTSLEKMTERLRLTDRVFFLGHLENPYPLLKSVHGLVLASEYEGQGLVLLEAIALNIPFIASKNSGTSYLAEYGDDFFLGSSIEDIASGICRLLDGEVAVPVNFNLDTYTKGALDKLYGLLNQ